MTPPPLAPSIFSDSVTPTMNLQEVYSFLKGKGIPDHYCKAFKGNVIFKAHKTKMIPFQSVVATNLDHNETQCCIWEDCVCICTVVIAKL